MSIHFADIARHAAQDGAVSPEEILAMRQAGWANGKMTRAEAEAVFAAQNAAGEHSKEWSDFFVEAIQHYVLEGSEPRGHAGEDEARWLVDQVQRDGKVCSMTELEVLTRIIEKAQNVPESLKAFVLRVLEDEVMTGTGPTRCGGELSDTHVSEAECTLIRRVIFGAGGDRPAGVSRAEAEMLFRIKDATEHAANAPEFKRLFVQGVGNYLMGFASSSAQLTRERQLELDAFVADNTASVGRFMGEMAVATPNIFGMVFGRKPAAPSREERVAAEAELTGGEQDWLDAQIAVNGKVDAYDQALLKFLAEEAARV
ncbi:hypothetical protein [Erythrobacter sp. EC-HK427]|uniref:hypothetical protein n=1 Tax=Erythrobacter sp. EC-HK427 TaxID=2038396 RepID=UPI00125383C1|nr:hypothetical protein [Erythrobacter sp. EC-HK427]VVT02954.1 conserved hypothetical protein [Erythrobacter sp. EC-HK427]